MDIGGEEQVTGSVEEEVATPAANSTPPVSPVTVSAEAVSFGPETTTNAPVESVKRTCKMSAFRAMLLRRVSIDGTDVEPTLVPLTDWASTLKARELPRVDPDLPEHRKLFYASQDVYLFFRQHHWVHSRLVLARDACNTAAATMGVDPQDKWLEFLFITCKQVRNDPARVLSGRARYQECLGGAFSDEIGNLDYFINVLLQRALKIIHNEDCLKVLSLFLLHEQRRRADRDQGQSKRMTLAKETQLDRGSASPSFLATSSSPSSLTSAHPRAKNYDACFRYHLGNTFFCAIGYDVSTHILSFGLPSDFKFAPEPPKSVWNNFTKRYLLFFDDLPLATPSFRPFQLRAIRKGGGTIGNTHNSACHDDDSGADITPTASSYCKDIMDEDDDLSLTRSNSKRRNSSGCLFVREKGRLRFKNLAVPSSADAGPAHSSTTSTHPETHINGETTTHPTLITHDTRASKSAGTASSQPKRETDISDSPVKSELLSAEGLSKVVVEFKAEALKRKEVQRIFKKVQAEKWSKIHERLTTAASQ